MPFAIPYNASSVEYTAGGIIKSTLLSQGALVNVYSVFLDDHNTLEVGSRGQGVIISRQVVLYR